MWGLCPPRLALHDLSSSFVPPLTLPSPPRGGEGFAPLSLTEGEGRGEGGTASTKINPRGAAP